MGKLGQAAGGRATAASPSASPAKSWSLPEKECSLGVCMCEKERAWWIWTDYGSVGMHVSVGMQGLFECVMVDIQHSQYVVWVTPESKEM